ncbi:MAG TPA: DUF1572 family protein [Thermoanaerobaculia bacterium]|nr:DUF1572 family protein [Thermoanaerobaculia bacterium]
MPDFAAVTLHALRSRMTGVFPAQVRAAIADLSDEQLWWRPNESSNSIGNLILHLTGSLNLYLNRNIGGIAYERDRAAEFAQREAVPKAELLAKFDDMVARAERTFDALTFEKLGEASPEPGMYDLVIEDVINALAHFSTHVGQILWIAKSVTDASMNDVWMKSHRREGAWKKPQ